MDRRTFLALPGLGAVGVLVAGCSAYPDQAPEPPVRTSQRLVSYGDDPNQVAELSVPDGTSRGVVVVIHGGFWKAAYDRSLGQPLAASLAAAGWTAWNLEYRRMGNGGGLPGTLDDVAAGIDALADVAGLDTSTVITLGHSAGGHLAAWAASRGRCEQWAERVPVTAVVSQAGVLDLRAAYDLRLGGGAVEALLGHPPGPADDPVDPIRQVPLDVPVWCVHGTGDATVPISQSRSYVAAAKAAGASAELVEVAGDHFVVIDPASEAWARTMSILDTLG
ncbi:MAG: Acetyl esterase/lipase [Nocardioides sp.]|nr:Acetyl esterase/lipase [Nocardioides sp.]